MALETTITTAIVEYLNGLPHCVVEKIPADSRGKIGRSDLSGCINGRAFRIEVKSKEHNNKPTKAQQLNLKKWSRAGAIAFSAYSVEDVRYVLTKCVCNNHEYVGHKY